jgi:predicted branched-subunit amino acid permease
MSGNQGVTFTRAGIQRGARQAVPLVIGTFPFGLVVGVISDAKGLSMLETLVMCGLVFAGSAQLLALELWTEPAPVLAATLAALVVNMRLAPMGAALAPWLDRLRGVLLGVALALWVFWMIAVSIGHVFGAVVRLAPGHPLYFAATATFCAILVPVWQGVRRDLLPWMLSAAVAMAAWAAGLGAPWPLLAGALSGAALGAWMELRRT